MFNVNIQEEKAPEVKSADTEVVEAGKEVTETAPVEESEVTPQAEEETPIEAEVKKPKVDETPPAIKKEFKQLRTSNRQLEIEKARLEGRLEALAERGEKPAAKPVVADDPSDPKPNQSNFEGYDEYTEAVADWKYRQNRKVERAEEATKTEQRNVAEIIKTARTKDPGFGEKLGELVEEYGPLTPAMMKRVKGSEHEADLLLHFANHPEEYARIKSLPDAEDVAVEIFKIQSKFAGAPATATPIKRITTAPEPVNTLKGRSSANNFDIFNPGNSTEDNIAYWKTQRAKKT